MFIWIQSILELILSILEYKSMASIVPIVEETCDFEAPGDLAELVVSSVTRRRVTDGTSEAPDVGHIAGGVHAMSCDVSNPVQNSVLGPLRSC